VLNVRIKEYKNILNTNESHLLFCRKTSGQMKKFKSSRCAQKSAKVCSPFTLHPTFCKLLRRLNYVNNCLRVLKFDVHRRTRRGVPSPTGLKNFKASSVFRASSTCSKILNDKKYLNTVKNSKATLFLRANASC